MNFPPSFSRLAISANFCDWNRPTYSNMPCATITSNVLPPKAIGASMMSVSIRFDAGSWIAMSMPW